MSQPRRTRRLTANDWVDAALDLIAAESVASLKITRLCDVLNVTKGSFYWHFNDIDALCEAMAERWRETNAAQLSDFSELWALPSTDRVVMLGTMLMNKRSMTVETAIRDWARTNEKVAESVRRIDNQVFNTVYTSLVELELGQQQARLFAGLLVYAGIGYIHGHDGIPQPTEDETRAVIQGLLASAGTNSKPT